jgi:hypothetical protein
MKHFYSKRILTNTDHPLISHANYCQSKNLLFRSCLPIKLLTRHTSSKQSPSKRFSHPNSLFHSSELHAQYSVFAFFNFPYSPWFDIVLRKQVSHLLLKCTTSGYVAVWRRLAPVRAVVTLITIYYYYYYYYYYYGLLLTNVSRLLSHCIHTTVTRQISSYDNHIRPFARKKLICLFVRNGRRWLLNEDFRACITVIGPRKVRTYEH